VDNARFPASLALAKHVKFREERFGGVLFETRSEKVFTLNPTGAAIVQAIASGGDVAASLHRLSERFTDDGSIERDVAAFIAELRDKDLLVE
jgi:hypothetical protein